MGASDNRVLTPDEEIALVREGRRNALRRYLACRRYGVSLDEWAKLAEKHDRLLRGVLSLSTSHLDSEPSLGLSGDLRPSDSKQRGQLVTDRGPVAEPPSAANSDLVVRRRIESNPAAVGERLEIVVEQAINLLVGLGHKIHGVAQVQPDDVSAMNTDSTAGDIALPSGNASTPPIVARAGKYLRNMAEPKSLIRLAGESDADAESSEPSQMQRRTLPDNDSGIEPVAVASAHPSLLLRKALPDVAAFQRDTITSKLGQNPALDDPTKGRLLTLSAIRESQTRLLSETTLPLSPLQTLTYVTYNAIGDSGAVTQLDGVKDTSRIVRAFTSLSTTDALVELETLAASSFGFHGRGASSLGSLVEIIALISRTRKFLRQLAESALDEGADEGDSAESQDDSWFPIFAPLRDELTRSIRGSASMDAHSWYVAPREVPDTALDAPALPQTHIQADAFVLAELASIPPSSIAAEILPSALRETLDVVSRLARIEADMADMAAVLQKRLDEIRSSRLSMIATVNRFAKVAASPFSLMAVQSPLQTGAAGLASALELVVGSARNEQEHSIAAAIGRAMVRTAGDLSIHDAIRIANARSRHLKYGLGDEQTTFGAEIRGGALVIHASTFNLEADLVTWFQACDLATKIKFVFTLVHFGATREESVLNLDAVMKMHAQRIKNGLVARLSAEAGSSSTPPPLDKPRRIPGWLSDQIDERTWDLPYGLHFANEGYEVDSDTWSLETTDSEGHVNGTALIRRHGRPDWSPLSTTIT